MNWKQRYATQTPDQVAWLMKLKNEWVNNPDLLPHGTAIGYKLGDCRCDDCTQAHAESRREYLSRPGVRDTINDRKRKKYEEDPAYRDQLIQDVKKYYQDRKSDPEWLAQRNLQKQVSDRRRRSEILVEMQANPDHEKHGTRSGYKAGCRCDSCRIAAVDYNREQRNRKRNEQ